MRACRAFFSLLLSIMLPPNLPVQIFMFVRTNHATLLSCLVDRELTWGNDRLPRLLSLGSHLVGQYLVQLWRQRSRLVIRHG